MLNPFASNFQPTIVDHSIKPTLDTPKKKSQPKKPKKPKTKDTKSQTKPKDPQPATTNHKARDSQPGTSNHKTKDSQSSTSKSRDSQPSASNHKPRDLHTKKSKGRAKVTPTHQDIFTQESPFIAIEAAIDPVHRIDIQPINSRRQSLIIEKKFEHGYERYIDWIDRSLSCYDTVTVVGMENAIVDIVSIVTILYDRKIAAHDDVETFTMNPRNDKMTSCIQVKLHPFF